MSEENTPSIDNILSLIGGPPQSEKRKKEKKEKINKKPPVVKQKSNVITEDFKCIICNNFSKEFRTTRCCQSSMCRQCGRNWIERSIEETVECKCPYCRESFSKRSLLVNETVQRAINEIKQKCIFCNNENVTIGTYDEHVSKCHEAPEEVQERYLKSAQKLTKRKRQLEEKESRKHRKRITANDEEDEDISNTTDQLPYDQIEVMDSKSCARKCTYFADNKTTINNYRYDGISDEDLLIFKKTFGGNLHDCIDKQVPV